MCDRQDTETNFFRLDSDDKETPLLSSDNSRLWKKLEACVTQSKTFFTDKTYVTSLYIVYDKN